MEVLLKDRARLGTERGCERVKEGYGSRRRGVWEKLKLTILPKVSSSKTVKSDDYDRLSKVKNLIGTVDYRTNRTVWWSAFSLTKQVTE